MAAQRQEAEAAEAAKAAEAAEAVKAAKAAEGHALQDEQTPAQQGAETSDELRKVEGLNITEQSEQSPGTQCAGKLRTVEFARGEREQKESLEMVSIIAQ